MKKNYKYRAWYDHALKKTFLVMRLVVVISLVCIMQSFALDSYTQNSKISISVKEMKLDDILMKLESETNYRFAYNKTDINVNQVYTIDISDAQIKEVLDKLFTDKDISYKIINQRQIILSRSSRSYTVSQQSKSVSGKVTDSTGTPLPGVSVVVKGTTTGTITNFDGKYTLLNVPGDATLVYSFVGMKAQEISVDGKTSINVKMEEETVGIDEVVAVGYGTQKKVNLTGAISNIQEKELRTTTATGMAQKLQGKISGLNIRQNNGEPGDFANALNIRGLGEPLYIIDGISRRNSDFQKLNAEDVESISILKDASAAIYGLNAANGVIIVTTKTGGTGKTKFQFSSNIGFSTPTDQVEMANAYQYYTLRNEANINMGLDPYISSEELAKWGKGGIGYESTDWADETFTKFAVRKEYSLSAEGGNDKISYYFNLNAVDDGGMLRSKDLSYNKLNFRSSISTKLTNDLTANVKISGYSDKKDSPVKGVFQIWRGTVSSLPFRSVYANDNPKYLNRVQDGQSINPVAISQSDLTGYLENKNEVFETSLDLSYRVPFIKGLELKGVVSYDRLIYMSKSLSKDHKMYDYDVETDSYVPTYFNKPASIYNKYDNNYNTTLQAQALYKTKISDKHNIGATLVYEQTKKFRRYASILKYYDFYTNDQIDQAGETNAESNGNEKEVRAMSYLGRLNYDYKGKYLVEFAGRYDGSYRYHPDRRWGFFPVISGGWRISEENFMQDQASWLSNMKIRGSYGIIGQDVGDPFQYVTAFSTSGGGSYEFTNGELINGVASPSIVNENLTWMESTIKNFGVDLSFFKNKYSITADIYQRDRTGIPAYRSVDFPNTYGGTFPQENINSDRVRGIEFSFAHQNTIGELIYSVMGNINFARTKYVDIKSSPPFTSSVNKYRSGASNRWSGIVWTYNVIGQFQTEEEILQAPIQNGSNGNKYVLPGDFIYEDVDGNGIINSNDMKPNFYDDSTPKWNYGLTINASWKGFDISALFQGAANFSVRYKGAYTSMFYGEGNLPAYYMDRWHKADPYDSSSEWIPGKWPAMRLSSNYDNGLLYAENSVWRRDASYLRFKNLELGYTLKQGVIRTIGINYVRVFININNVYTWADSFIKAFDPEAIAGDFSAGWNYPITKNYNIGINVNF